MSERIRIEEETYAALSALKGQGERFDELLSRLLEERHDCVRDGAGLWEGSDASEKVREAREEMEQGVGNL